MQKALHKKPGPVNRLFSWAKNLPVFSKNGDNLNGQTQPKLQAHSSSYKQFMVLGFDGEKNLGEIGPIKDYRVDHAALRLRSWQSFLESDISQTVVKKFAKWTIGSGLKLQSQPQIKVLESEGIALEPENFNVTTESRFGILAKSRHIDYSKLRNLNLIAKKAFFESLVGGDVLVILRLEDEMTVQLVDGGHVQSPFDRDQIVRADEKGNRILHGIEIDKKGEHVAYYVRKGGRLLATERVEAKTKDGLIVAFMVYGLEYRLDSVRGLPWITAVMESIKKMERYKEAVLGSAEENAKIAYQIVHQIFSTGENVLQKNIVKAFDADAVSTDLPRSEEGKELANTIAATTNKQALNMPIGSKIERVAANQQELYFKDYFGAHIDMTAATLGIPPEVAMSKYDSNFSASRAALKDWEHTLNVDRANFQFQFYQPIYDFWLHVQILKNKVQAPGYLQAFETNNIMVLESYRNATFEGASVPHIDPKKEVEAERLKLGNTADSIPLTTIENATGALNGGDSDSNMEQYAKELEKSKDLDIVSEVKTEPPPEPPGDDDS